jgi:hypothetical protein
MLLTQLLLHGSSSWQPGSTEEIFMKVIEHVTEIAAPTDAVWAVLIDPAAYPEWNPFLILTTRPERVGQRLSVTIRAGKRTMTLAPTVTTFEQGRSICWSGRLGVRGIFDGAHELHVERIDASRSRFTHRETFRGVLVPFMRSVLRDTDAGFAAMNAALAGRAEGQVLA